MEKIFMSKPSMPPMEEYIKEISDLWQTGQITNNGEKHKLLERLLKEYLNANNLSLFVNGHMSLEIALSTIKRKGEVITSPFTFTSTLLSILRNNMQPVFCDIYDHNYTINADLIEELITEKTCAILPVHIFGNICNIKKIDEIAAKYNIPVIYDAAQAFGITVDGMPVANFGSMSMFSFHATKVFHTIEGGCLTYSNSALAEHFSLLRNFGLSDEISVVIGTNAKMPETNAAMGLCNLRHIDEYIAVRKMLTQKYDELLSGCKGILINKIPSNVSYNYCYYHIRIIPEVFGCSRDEIYETLINNGVYARKYYFPLVSEYPIVNYSAKNDNLRVAKNISQQILVLPLHTNMSVEDVEHICKIILALFT